MLFYCRNIIGMECAVALTLVTRLVSDGIPHDIQLVEALLDEAKPIY